MKPEISVDKNIKLLRTSASCAKEKYTAAMASRDHLLPWLNWVHYYELFDTKEAGTEAMQKFQKDKAAEFKKGTGYTFDIFYDNKFAGSIDFQKISKENNYLEIGYWLSKEFTGKGIMTRAVNALTDIAFNQLKMHCVVIRAADKNEASCNVAKRCGFTLEATLKDRLLIEGTYYNECVFSKIKK